ncbi:hypothetical protein P3G55_00545 [Leptospira sp. 96542]|nr:hypothetical protein [Leptospira sp. 96542]
MNLFTNIRTKYINSFVYIALSSLFFLLFYFKFHFLLEGKPINGWDTPGHIVLVDEFQKLFTNFQATGWSDTWFGGFPVFYFYPPFFYLLIVVISYLFSLSLEVALYYSIFFVICFLSYAIFQFCRVLFFRKYPIYLQLVLGFISILFYLNYAGDGLQGTSLVGIIEGTFISSFAHGVLLFSILSLELFRKTKNKWYLAKFASFVCILFYSHLLTTVFLFFSLLIYFFIWRRELLKHWKTLLASFLMILALVWPIIFNYLIYSPFTSGIYYGFAYPPLLSILGKDIYDLAIRNREFGSSIYFEYIIGLLSTGRWVSVLAIILVVANFKNLLVAKRSRPTLVLLLFFLWLTVDHSLGYIFPNFKIHSYRAFDLFYLSFSILFPLVIIKSRGSFFGRIPKKYILMTILGVQIHTFLMFDPFLHQGYLGAYRDDSMPSKDLIDYTELVGILSLLPKGSLVQPEVIRNKEFAGSPHYILPILYQLGLRNNMGLTVESSLYSTLLFNWQEFGFAHSFRWGTDIDWRDELYAFSEREVYYDLYLDFLQRSGVEYMIGASPQFQKYIQTNSDRLKLVANSETFVLVKLIDPKEYIKINPIGVIDENLLVNKQQINIREFIKISNFIQTSFSAKKMSTNLVLLDTNHISNLYTDTQKFSFLILLTNDPTIGDYSLKLELEKKGYSVLLLPKNFSMDDIPMVKEKTNSFLQNHQFEFGKLDSNWKFTNVSYFPKLRDSWANGIYISDTARIALYGNHPIAKQAEYGEKILTRDGRIYFVLMLVSFFVFLISSLKIYTSYCSFLKPRE